MSAKNKSGHIFNRHIKFFRQEQAEACRVKNTSHANNLVGRQARCLLQNTNHHIKRVGDTNHKSIRTMILDASTNLMHHLGVDTNQIVAAHAWLARHTSGHNHHITSSQRGIIIGTRRICVKTLNRACLRNIKRLALRDTFGNIKKHHIAKLFQPSQKRQSTADITSANKRDFISCHINDFHKLQGEIVPRHVLRLYRPAKHVFLVYLTIK